MKQTFRKLGDHTAVDLANYVNDIINSSENVRIYVGSDSQNFGQVTTYATVVVLHYGNNGAHVLYSKERVPRIKNTFSRLWNEVERSLIVAEHLLAAGIPKVDYIDLDLNPDPIYRSNSILRSAVGYVESMGYVARTKPYAAAASTCADAICH